MDVETQKRLDALDQKLKAMEALKKDDTQVSKAAQKFDAMGLGYRMMIELTAGVLLGAFIGLGLDRFFGTSPWLLMVMVLVGLAAGIRVMMQSVSRHETKRLQKLSEEENGD